MNVKTEFPGVDIDAAHRNLTTTKGTAMNENQELNYDPNNLLDTIIKKLGLKNDAALAHALEIHPPILSKIRHCKMPVGALMLIRMHEISDLSIKDLRALMGDRRAQFRSGDLIQDAA